MEPADGVEGHKVVEHNLELLEDVHEAVGVGFTAGCQVPTDLLIGLGIAGQLFVPSCQLSDPSDFFINHRNGRKRHFEGHKEMCTLQLRLLSEEHWRLGGMARQGLSQQSGRYKARGEKTLLGGWKEILEGNVQIILEL